MSIFGYIGQFFGQTDDLGTGVPGAPGWQKSNRRGHHRGRGRNKPQNLDEFIRKLDHLQRKLQKWSARPDRLHKLQNLQQRLGRMQPWANQYPEAAARLNQLSQQVQAAISNAPIPAGNAAQIIASPVRGPALPTIKEPVGVVPGGPGWKARCPGGVPGRPIPTGFEPARYLSLNPDVGALAMRMANGAAYHYSCNGAKEGRQFAGYGKRPGYLGGIFSNWNQID